jgi:hypothetical protein
MNLMTTSMTALAAFGILAGASLAASACPAHKNHVTAAVTPPVTEDVAAPASAVDPVLIAEAKAAIVPVAPKEEPLEETASD